MKFILGYILLIFNISSYAATPQALEYFNQGSVFFKEKNYQSALEYYQRAYQENLNTTSLHYNLGVTYFKLEDYSLAEKHFLLASKNPKMASIVYFNLGLVKKQQDNPQSARQWFQKAYDTSSNEKIRKLAAIQLEPRAKTSSSNWGAYLFLNAGYNDNVTLDNDTITIASNQADSFMELFAFTRGLISGTNNNGLLLKARLYSEAYQTLPDYNLNEIHAGIYKTYPFADWNTESGLYFNYSTQGGRDYLQSANLSFSGKLKLSNQTRLRMRLRLHAIEAIDPIYASLSGNAEDLRIETRWSFTSKNRIRVYYQFDNNTREDSRTLTRFSSRSPIRHRFRFDYYFPLYGNLKSQLSAEYRQSQYKDNNTDTTTGLNQQRVDDRLRGKLALNHSINKQLALNLEYAYTQNTSTINTYEYTQNVILAGVLYSF